MESTTTINLGYLDLGIAACLVLLSSLLSWRLQLGLHGDMLWGAARSFLQLVLTGFVLLFIFQQDRWYWVVLALVIMLGVAVYTAQGRVKEPLLGKSWIFAVAIVSGSMVVLLYVASIVLRLEQHPGLHWYAPRYVIPLAGMIIGNAMNAAALAVSRFAGDLHTRRAEVETALSLGATATEAVAGLRRDALRTAIIPSVNSMLVVGVVSLPGMMTGQILAGNIPTQAVNYQVMVVYMITAAATLTSVIGVIAATHRVFTPAQQLRTFAEYSNP